MSEINSPNFGINQVNFNGVQRKSSDSQSDNKEREDAQIKDFGDPKAEALGRSMLVKEVDNTNHDLKTLIENPQVAENSDKMFEAAFAAAKDAGVENPYEEAAKFATGSI